MASILHSVGSLSPAERCWEEALQIQSTLGDDRGRAVSLSNMGTAVAERGNVSRARILWQQALELFEQVGDEDGKASTLSIMDRFATRRTLIYRSDPWVIAGEELHREVIELLKIAREEHGRAEPNHEDVLMTSDAQIESFCSLIARLQVQETVGKT